MSMEPDRLDVVPRILDCRGTAEPRANDKIDAEHNALQGLRRHV